LKSNAYNRKHRQSERGKGEGGDGSCE